MATTFQQRRRRAIIIGIIIALAILGFGFSDAIKETFTGVPGYARQPPAGKHVDLLWPALESASWEAGEQPMAPDDVKALVGERVRLRGFIYPISEHYDSASRIYLAPKPSSCYFCSPPAVTEMVEVNIANERMVRIFDNRSITVFGVFRVATTPDAAALYYIDDATLMLGK